MLHHSFGGKVIFLLQPFTESCRPLVLGSKNGFEIFTIKKIPLCKISSFLSLKMSKSKKGLKRVPGCCAANFLGVESEGWLSNVWMKIWKARTLMLGSFDNKTDRNRTLMRRNTENCKISILGQTQWNEGSFWGIF